MPFRFFGIAAAFYKGEYVTAIVFGHVYQGGEAFLNGLTAVF